MSDLSNLLLLLLLVAVVGLWLKLSAARERAVHEARAQCLKHGLQLLDETVGLRGLRVRRVHGQRRLERGYGFEVSIDGNDREAGRVWMIGNALSGLSLPTIEVRAGTDVVSSASPGVIDNVVPLRRVPRIDDRRH